MIAATLVGLALASAPRAVGFGEVVNLSLEHHPAMRIAQADADRAVALVEQARAPSLPTLNASGAYTRLDGDRVLNDRVIQGANQLTGLLQAGVPLVAPARWAQWSRASQNASAAKATSVDVRRQVALGAARAWLTVLGQRQVVEASERAVTVAQAHVTQAKERRSGGVGTRLEEIRAAQELSVAQTQRATAQGGLVRAQEALGVAAGADEPLDASREEPTLGTERGLGTSLELATTQRLDVLAAQARESAATNATSWDWADYLPLLSASAQGQYQNPPTLTVPLWSFQAQLVLTIPLYDGGLRYGQQHERHANEASAKAQAESVLRQAKAEVRTAFAQVTLADDALSSARAAAKEAADALTASQEAFRAGAVTNLDVVDAERRARDADTQVALAENASRQARLDLLAASGEFPK